MKEGVTLEDVSISPAAFSWFCFVRNRFCDAEKVLAFLRFKQELEKGLSNHTGILLGAA